MARHLLQRKDGRWDEVDEYTAKNRAHCIDNDGQTRYNGTFVTIGDDNRLSMGGNFSSNDLQWLLRYTGARTGVDPNATVQGGMFHEPEMLRFVIKGKRLIHVLGTGETYKQVAA
jgi:hypothetical protein